MILAEKGGPGQRLACARCRWRLLSYKRHFRFGDHPSARNRHKASLAMIAPLLAVAASAQLGSWFDPAKDECKFAQRNMPRR